MKIKKLILPLIGFMVVGCGGNSLEPATSDPGNSTSATNPLEEGEIDPTELNALIGFDVYAMIPKIFSEDYEIGDYSSEEYPVDIYIDLFDWTEEDVDDYNDALENMLDVDQESGYIIKDNLFIFADLDDSSGEIIPIINIYSIGDEGGEGGDIEGIEIALEDIKDIFGFDVIALLPVFNSSDLLVWDYSTPDFPRDVYIDLYDWTLDDAYDYDDALNAKFELVDFYGDEFYEVVKDVYVYIGFDEDSELAFINIFSNVAKGSSGGETGGNTGEPGVPGAYTSTIDSKGRIETDIAEGLINSHLDITDGDNLKVDFALNTSTVSAIFKNDAGEIRIYKGNTVGNGGQLTISSSDKVEFTSITLTFGKTNGGVSVNGGASITDKSASVTVTLAANTTTITLKAVGSERVDIALISVSYNII